MSIRPAPGRHKGYPGTGFKGPVYTGYKRPSDSKELDYPIRGQNRIRRVEREEDFLWDESPAATDLGSLYDHSPAGTPTLARVADGVDGLLQIKLAATNEREFVGYYWGDQVMIPATARPVVDFILIPEVLPGANERMWFGLTTELAGILALQQDIELAARRIGFSIDADGNLELETDDGTTDRDDQVPQAGVTTLVAGTQYCFRIDMQDTGRVSFQLAEGDGDNWREIGYLAASALASTDKLQVACFVQKDSGTGVPEILLDYVCASWDRSSK